MTGTILGMGQKRWKNIYFFTFCTKLELIFFVLIFSTKQTFFQVHFPLRFGSFKTKWIIMIETENLFVRKTLRIDEKKVENRVFICLSFFAYLKFKGLSVVNTTWKCVPSNNDDSALLWIVKAIKATKQFLWTKFKSFLRKLQPGM